MHQSNPGVRRRRVSQPSIHLPRSVYLPSMNTGTDGFSRFSLGAKNSSFANSTAPPMRSDARSISSVKSITYLSHKKACQKPDRKGGLVSQRKPLLTRGLLTLSRAELFDPDVLKQIRRHHKPSAHAKKSFLQLRSVSRQCRASTYAGDESFPA